MLRNMSVFYGGQFLAVSSSRLNILISKNSGLKKIIDQKYS